MPNKFHQKESSQKPQKTKRGTKHTNMPMKTANWAGLPGKSGPERSNGVEKIETNAKSEGL